MMCLFEGLLLFVPFSVRLYVLVAEFACVVFVVGLSLLRVCVCPCCVVQCLCCCLIHV